MARSFLLPHAIDLSHHAGWLWYSHAVSPPTDRQVVPGFTDPKFPGVKLANWYFLSDAALQLIQGTKYDLTSRGYGRWHLWFEDDGRAALFKLRFM